MPVVSRPDGLECHHLGFLNNGRKFFLLRRSRCGASRKQTLEVMSSGFHAGDRVLMAMCLLENFEGL